MTQEIISKLNDANYKQLNPYKEKVLNNDKLVMFHSISLRNTIYLCHSAILEVFDK